MLRQEGELHEAWKDWCCGVMCQAGALVSGARQIAKAAAKNSTAAT